jgi:multiple sugar transport system substrate-binding protein
MTSRRTVLAALAALCLPTAASAQPKTVTIWHPFNLETDMIHGGIKAFNEAQNEYRIDARILPAAQIPTELIKAVATGSVPDLVTLDNPVVASFSAQGTLTDLTDWIVQSQTIRPGVYLKGPWDSVQWKGRSYGVPRDANTIALYYNADMFRQKGLDPDKPPRTWSELRAAAEKLRDRSKSVYGLAFCAVQAEEGTFQWLPFLHQAGGSVDKLDQPEAADALNFWAGMVKDDVVSRDVINMRQYEAANTFMAGNSAMVLGGPWELPRMQNEAKFDWRLALLPVKDGKDIQASPLGGYDFVVPKGARQIEGAFRFIEAMSRPEVLAEGWKTGRLAPRTDVTVPNPLWPQAYSIYKEQVQSARARGPHPQWPDISRAIQTAMQEALTGTRPADAALKDAARKIQPILAKIPLN